MNKYKKTVKFYEFDPLAPQPSRQAARYAARRAKKEPVYVRTAKWPRRTVRVA